MTPPRKLSGVLPSDDVIEACGHLRDLWHGVGGFRSVESHVYPTGAEAIWMRVDRANDAYPEEWMGFPVVVINHSPREPI